MLSTTVFAAFSRTIRTIKNSARTRLAIGHSAVMAVSVVLGLFASTRPAMAQSDLLEIHNDSLTTYKPAAKSMVQAVSPRAIHRGTTISGGVRAGSGLGMVLGAAPGNDPVGGARGPGGINLVDGTVSIMEVDLALPARGNSGWMIGRTYNVRQYFSGADYDSTGPQGNNWFQTSMPEIIFYDDADNAKDMIYIMYGADRFAEFKRTGSSSNAFRGVNGAAGVVEYVSGSPDTYVYHDLIGNRFHFMGGNTSGNKANWQFWKKVDPAGNTAYVYSSSSASSAVTNGYNSGGQILEVYDGEGRKYGYTYSSGLLTKVEVDLSGRAYKVEYTYYGASESYGSANDLKTVTITTPQTDSGINEVRTKHYRYWKGTFNASTNPGHPSAIQYEVDFEGYRNADWADSTFDADPLTMGEGSLKPYASAYYEYDSSRRIIKTWANGQCGCSGGGGNGTYQFEYETNGSYSDTSGYNTAWMSRTTIDRPDSAYEVQYFDEVGQPLAHITANANPDNTSPAPSFWVTFVVRSSTGLVTEIYTPANLGSYTHSSSTYTHNASSGLVRAFDRYGSGDGAIEGLIKATKYQVGTLGTASYDGRTGLTTSSKTVAGFTYARAFPSSMRRYHTAGTGIDTTANYDETTYTYTFWTGDAVLMPKSILTTNPAVSAGNNGSGTATTRKVFLRTDGTTAFSRADSEIYSYTKYSGGLVSMMVQDVTLNDTTDIDTTNDDPSGIYGITETSSGLHRKTTHAYDSLGRADTSTLSDGKVTKSYYTVLGDRRAVSVSFPKYVSGSGTYYGPASYSVSNQSGRGEVSATLVFTSGSTTSAITSLVDETMGDPIDAVERSGGGGGIATLFALSRQMYDESGSILEESRTYTTIPLAFTSDSSTNYDTTVISYDDAGRRIRTVAADGTITRTYYDSIGRFSYSRTGINDAGETGSSLSGTNDMVKTDDVVYDAAGVGNGLVTKRTAYVEDSTTGKRETSYLHDDRGRVIVTVNPVAPHVLNKVDNLGRTTAVALYSSDTGLDASDDPTSLATNRMALSRTYYDEMGRAWKSARHKIDAADGSDDDSLYEAHWWDADGRSVKVDGSQLTKTLYDRLGRTTHQFILAQDDDGATYASADDVSGDIVLVESQTTFESEDSDRVVMTATIQRHHDDTTTTGALDGNGDANTFKYTAANVAGRIQIAAYWHDDLDRMENLVQYGTYGGSDFDRKPSGSWLSVPARSDTALVVTYAYNDNGTQLSVTDPKALAARTEYDEAARRTKSIANYTNGTPGGGANDDEDQTVAYTYDDGVMTKLTADMPSGTNDQDTDYTKGTVKDTGDTKSKIATGHLINKQVYPPQTGGQSAADRTVTIEYNAQGEVTYRKDQDGNETVITLDAGGRESKRTFTTVASGFDTAVRAIGVSYDGLGRVEKVTQYSDTAATTIIDQVQYTFDGWGNVTKFEQDRDGAVGAGGVADYEVNYTYEKALTEDTSPTRNFRNTLRCTGMTMPSGAALTYEYETTTGHTFDRAVSRVSRVKHGSTLVAKYRYNGLDMVVGTDYPEPDVYSNLYSSSGAYDRLDRFDRIVTNLWKADRSTDRDFVKLALSYDRNSNITVVDDQLHKDSGSGNGIWDAAYGMDNLNRLISAREGHWDGTEITTGNRKFEQLWTLGQTGNWGRAKIDYNGDGDYADTVGGVSETDDTRVHSDANEIKTRDTDSNSSVNYTLVYNKRGDLTNDGQAYKFKYDAVGRLKEIKNQSDVLLAEYVYNGLGYRIGWHYDVDNDGTVENTSDDPWYYFVYDIRWRMVASIRGSDSYDPDGGGPLPSTHAFKEQWTYNNAGLNGAGGSSYIDSVIMRDRDDTNGWSGAADGTLEERRILIQNWRADVVAVLRAATGTSGGIVEHVRYTAYGEPRCIQAGDLDYDGDVDATDQTTFNSINGGTYDYLGDLNLDGADDSSDSTQFTTEKNLTLTCGRGVASRTDTKSRKGYAGYEGDGCIVPLAHTRRVVSDSRLGRALVRSRADNAFAIPTTIPSGPYDDCIYLESYEDCMDCCYGFHAIEPLDLLRCMQSCRQRWPDPALTPGQAHETCEEQLERKLREIQEEFNQRMARCRPDHSDPSEGLQLGCFVTNESWRMEQVRLANLAREQCVNDLTTQPNPSTDIHDNPGRCPLDQTSPPKPGDLSRRCGCDQQYVENVGRCKECYWDREYNEDHRISYGQCLERARLLDVDCRHNCRGA